MKKRQTREGEGDAHFVLLRLARRARLFLRVESVVVYARAFFFFFARVCVRKIFENSCCGPLILSFWRSFARVSLCVCVCMCITRFACTL